MVRIFTRFLLFEGTGEAQILPLPADLCSILSIENQDGALSTAWDRGEVVAGAAL